MEKKTANLMIFVFAGMVGLTAGQACADITSDLVAWWAFNDGSGDIAIDRSGNGIHGTLKPGQPSGPTWVAGKIDGCLEFDTAKQNYVECGPHPALDITGSLTFTAWVKKIGPWIVGTGEPFRYDTIIWKSVSDGSTRAYRLSRDAAANGVCLSINAAGGEAKVRGPTAVNDDQWHHIAGVYDVSTGEAFLYVDGNLDASGSTSGSILGSAGQPLLIGFDGGTVRFWGGLIDEVRVYNRALTSEDIQELYESTALPTPKGNASSPSPADGATDVPADVVLSWKAGEYADKHDVYFGTGFDDVSAATKADPEHKTAKLLGDESYAPGRLEFGGTYYWRIDEVNAAPDFTVYKGDVWQFTVEPVSYPIANVTATASSSEAGQGPENTINGSGLDADDLHSVDTTAMWLSQSGGLQPTWIEYEFDKIYKLHQMWAWNYNGVGFNIILGLKDVTIEYSTDGTNYTQLGGYEFAQASGTDRYACNITVDFDGVVAKYVRITAASNWTGGMADQYGLSEVRFFKIPMRAREPSPASGTIGLDPEAVILGWRAGRGAVSHDVHFSANEQAVINGTAYIDTVNSTSYDAGPLQSLELGKTYYWRIDEVNDADHPKVWQGDVWDFAIADYRVVDDMESYGDAGTPGPPPPSGSRIWFTWKDGYGWNYPDAQLGNGTGSMVDAGNISHGGKQSLKYNYDNTGTAKDSQNNPITVYYSEARANVDNLAVGRDWSVAGAKALTLWFHGDVNNTAAAADQMYVKLNGAKVTYDGNMDDIKQESWHEWNIDLTSFAGVNLQNVTEMTIGFGDEINKTAPGGSGVVYFDDIRLYPARCIPSLRKPPADLNNDCIVDYLDVEVMAADWLLSDSVTPTEPPDDTGLEAYYKFDDGSGTFATDSSGNNHRATLDGPQWESIDVQVGTGALKFDGMDDRVTVDSFDVAGSGITLAAWIKPAAFGNDPRIISKAEGGGTAEHYWALLMGADPGDPEASLQCRLRTDVGTAIGTTAPSDEIQPDEWAHVAATWDRDDPNIRLYKNGEEIHSVSYGGTAVATAGPGVRIGIGNQSVDAGLGSRDRPFAGIIDDVRIYDYGLLDAQIKYLATKGLSEWYEPVPSVANLYNQEPKSQRKVDLKDYAVLVEQWLDEQLWP